LNQHFTAKVERGAIKDVVELARLKVSDIDSQRMIIRVVAGKGGKDRDLPLSPALLCRAWQEPVTTVR